MKALGIELGEIVSSFALFESGNAPRQVGDGRYFVVPTAIEGTAWGSRAAGPGSAWNGSARAANYTEFLRQVLARSAQFAGAALSEMAACRTVVASFGEASEIVSNAATAGFRDVIAVAPAQALVAGWIRRCGDRLEGERVVAAVAIGDQATSIGACRVVPTVLPVRQMTVPASLPIGISHWVSKVIHEVCRHVPHVEVDSRPMWELWVSAVELGDRSRRRPRQTAAWIGPYEGALLAPLEFASHDLTAFQNDSDFMLRVRRAIVSASSDLGRSVPDVLLLGGIGACWPITSDIWVGLPEPVVSSDPASDIACGAASWPFCTSAKESASLVIKHDATTVPKSGVGSFVNTSAEKVDAPLLLTPQDDRLRRLLDEELSDLSEDRP